MKTTLALLLAVALFAVYASADPIPDPEAEAFADPEAEAFADPEADPFAEPRGPSIKSIVEAVKKFYEKVCHKKDHDVCKKWAKEKITWKNAKKVGKELLPLVRALCDSDEGKKGAFKKPCELIKKF